jgi:hypothetical protein
VIGEEASSFGWWKWRALLVLSPGKVEEKLWRMLLAFSMVVLVTGLFLL